MCTFRFDFNCFITYVTIVFHSFVHDYLKLKKCDNYVIHSINHERYLQKVDKSTLSAFDEKRCYLNEIQSIPRDCF